MSRTTIRLDEHLLRQVKQLAARTGKTFTEIVQDALREVVARGAAPASRTKRVKLPTFGRGGVRPGIDISNNAAVREAMDEGVPLEKLR